MRPVLTVRATRLINEWTFWGTRRVDPVHQSPRTGAYGFFAKGTLPPSLILRPLVFLPFPTIFAGCLPRPIRSQLPGRVAFVTPHRYYSAVGLLTEPRSPLRFHL